MPVPYIHKYISTGRIVPFSYEAGPNCTLQQPIPVSGPNDFLVHYDSSSFNGCKLVTLRNRIEEDILVTFLFIDSTGLSDLTELILLFRDSSHSQILVDNSTIVQDENIALEMSGLGHADIWIYLKADSNGKLVLSFEFLIVTINSKQVYSDMVVFTIFF